MSDGNHEGRLSTVEANIGNMLNGQDEIKRYLSKTSDQTSAQLLELTRAVTRIETNQISYQKDCSEERKDHEKRISAGERTLARQSGQAVTIAAFVSSAIAIVGAWLSKGGTNIGN